MQQGSLNTNRITIRGIGARSQYGTNRVKAYFNAIPLTSGEGETVLEDIDLATIGENRNHQRPQFHQFWFWIGRCDSPVFEGNAGIGIFWKIRNHFWQFRLVAAATFGRIQRP